MVFFLQQSGTRVAFIIEVKGIVDETKTGKEAKRENKIFGRSGFKI